MATRKIISPTAYPPKYPGSYVYVDTDGDGLVDAQRQAVGHRVQSGPTGPWVALSTTVPTNSGANFTEPNATSGYLRVFSNEWVYHPSLHMFAQMPIDQVGGDVDVDLDDLSFVGEYARGVPGTVINQQYAFLSPAAKSGYFVKFSDGTFNTHPGLPRTGTDFDPREYDCTVSCQVESVESEFYAFESKHRYPIQNFTGIIFPELDYDMVYRAIGIYSKRLSTIAGDHLIATHVFEEPLTVYKSERLVFEPFSLTFQDTYAGKAPSSAVRLGDMVITDAAMNVEAHDLSFSIQTIVPFGSADIEITAPELTFEIV